MMGATIITEGFQPRKFFLLTQENSYPHTIANRAKLLYIGIGGVFTGASFFVAASRRLVFTFLLQKYL
jgi:hypothetical protein